MKERPILFSAPMVRALLDGSKSQTRRLVKPQPRAETEPVRPESRGSAKWVFMADADRSTRFAFGDVRCPFGVPGDRLWVRETFSPYIDASALKSRATYRADGSGLLPRQRWFPSIHMPRWASRITLEVTDVRVERLTSISEADTVAEGIERHVDDGVAYYGPLNEGHAVAQVAFERLWESINGAGSWDANPWVWVISFRKVTP